MKSKSLKSFVRQNRSEIDRHIIQACPNARKHNDQDREKIVLNEYTLYRWFIQWRNAQ